MAQRTVCLCDGKYIGIETIYSVVNGKQINIPEKLKDLRKKSKANQLFCPCGCGSNLSLVAGDRNLKEQHFRLKDGQFKSSCEVVIEGKNSIDSKIVLKCWLDDILQDSDIESRVPISDVSDRTRKYEFTFLSRSRRVGLSYCNERINLSEEKINLLKQNSKGICVIYILDIRNFGNYGQYPEGIMKVQNEQGYSLFLSVIDRDYSAARLRAAFSAQDIDGLWQEIILAEDYLDEFTIDDGKVVYQSVTLNELLERSQVEWKAGMEQERVKREERRKAQEEEQMLATERAAKQREEAEKARSEAEGRKRIEKQEGIEAERRFADSLLERMNQQVEQVRDSQGRRLIMCDYCGKIGLESQFSSYGGRNHMNLGTCYECQKNNPEATNIIMPERYRW